MVSVVVCTHNPRPDYWSRVIAALHAQTLPTNQWEMVVIDNASDTRPVPVEFLDWHPRAKMIQETRLGLTPARLRGIAEARGELLVFVDDDNVLANDYLEHAAEIAASHPFLGAFGGSISGAYESEPPAWAAPYLGYLAIVEVNEVRWSNARTRNPCCPRGAGLFVRRAIAREYAGNVSGDPVKNALDRVGTNLSSCGDTDLALTACDQGLGVGLFPQLRLEHLIPASRLELDYLCNLVRNIHRSEAILCALRGDPRAMPAPGRMERLFKAYQRLHLSREARLLDEASSDGRREGIEDASRQFGARIPAPLLRTNSNELPR